MAGNKRIAVIGAGLGGLAAAVRLAVSGFTVDLYEKNGKPGGKAGIIKDEGFRFDTGPSLLTMDFVLNDLFEYTGEKIGDYLKLIQLESSCKYFYSDKTSITAYTDLNLFAGEIESKTAENKDSIEKFLKYSKRIYDLTAGLFLFGDFGNLKNFVNLKALKTLLRINQIDPFRTMDQSVRRFFTDSKIIQLFNRYATYNGSNPYQAPATLNIIPYVEHVLGSFMPEGGIFKISEALMNLAVKYGVNINFNTPVTQIIYDENRAVKGIKLGDGSGNRLSYDAVLSNADAEFTYRTLLKDLDSASSKKISSAEPSTSAVVFYWGVEGKHDKLDLHNIIFSDDYKKEFYELFEKNEIPVDPTVYIYISSKINESDAPEGYENWFVMINTPPNSGQDWDKIKLESKNKILRKINSVLNIDLTDKIKYERTLDPSKIEEGTSSFRGSIYGISSNDRNSAFRRQSIKSKEYKNLYFCGGSSHPGGGIPLVLLSGKTASERIIKDYT